MRKAVLWVLILGLVFAVPAISAQAKVVLAGSTAVGNVLTVLSRTYMDKNPGSEIEINFDLLKKAQDHVLAGEADAVMVTRMFYKKLDTGTLKFTPIAKRIVMRGGKMTSSIDYGIAAVRISPELQKFLNFINSDEGKEIIKSIPNVDPL
jgi:hypothetical protein